MLRSNHRWTTLFYSLVLLVTACVGANRVETNGVAQLEDAQAEEAASLVLPVLEEADLNGAKLRVVATTSIIGDVVAHVGGQEIMLTTLIKAGQDPHSYEPSAGDLTLVADADVIFVNGWDLEESLVRIIANVAEDKLVVPVSANITPVKAASRYTDEQEAAEHVSAAADPHTWLDPHNVVQWTRNIEQVLSQRDPANAAVYAENAAAYEAELEALLAYVDEQLAMIPADRRKLVTNHDSLSYFAVAYDFEVIGTVIPASSTLAEPSARQLLELVDIMASEDVCTLFAENTANTRLVEVIADELNSCETVQVLTLYTGALGSTGSGAESYVAMVRTNVNTIVAGLK